MGMAAEDVMEGPPLQARPGPVDLTVLVPVYNEAENLKPLLEKLTVDLEALGKSYEILIVDDREAVARHNLGLEAVLAQ